MRAYEDQIHHFIHPALSDHTSWLHGVAAGTRWARGVAVEDAPSIIDTGDRHDVTAQQAATL